MVKPTSKLTRQRQSDALGHRKFACGASFGYFCKEGRVWNVTCCLGRAGQCTWQEGRLNADCHTFLVQAVQLLHWLLDSWKNRTMEVKLLVCGVVLVALMVTGECCYIKTDVDNLLVFVLIMKRNLNRNDWCFFFCVISKFRLFMCTRVYFRMSVFVSAGFTDCLLS